MEADDERNKTAMTDKPAFVSAVKDVLESPRQQDTFWD
jgi:hypothetical protein